MSVVLIAGGSVWFGPVKLAWYDVPSNYSYRVYADASDGNTYRLPPRFFSPYDYQFTLTAFNFAAERPVLDITWGSTQRRDLAVALSDATSPATALEIEDRLGRVRYNVRRRADLKRFLRTYTTNWNARREGHPAWGRRSEWWRFLQAPSQLWTFPRSDDIPAGVSIETIRLRRVFAFFDGAVYHEISDQEVLSVIPDR